MDKEEISESHHSHEENPQSLDKSQPLLGKLGIGKYFRKCFLSAPLCRLFVVKTAICRDSQLHTRKAAHVCRLHAKYQFIIFSVVSKLEHLEL